MSAQMPSNTYTIGFIVILSAVCAVVLSILASALREPQEIAKDLDRSKEMLIAAHIMTHEGYFLLPDGEPAKFSEGGKLVPGSKDDTATSQEILTIYRKRLVPKLVTPQGELTTFKDAGIDLNRYLSDYKKEGYYKQKNKLVYEILPNEGTDPIGYVIPVNGYGLWDAIYGYLAVKTDGNTVIGTTWYDQKETPGLGANIADKDWQAHFPGKKMFQESPDGSVDVKTSPLGITVVRGKVSEVLSGSKKADSAVDGMAGATLTGNGVTKAFKDVLGAYRPFLGKLYEQSKNQG